MKWKIKLIIGAVITAIIIALGTTTAIMKQRIIRKASRMQNSVV